MSATPPVIGVIHLGALPGSPRSTLPLDTILNDALRDARAFLDGGASGLIVENLGDVPFRPGVVEPYVVAAMTLAARAVQAEVPLPVGVNVLRNDVQAAVSIAAATSAAFVRANIHSGAFVTDQGIIQGAADETLRLRRRLGAGTVAIWADVLVKHAHPVAPIDLLEMADDLVTRELADALILTGQGTGKPADPNDARRLRFAFPDIPIYIGSGTTPDTAPQFLPWATGFIVGTWVKQDGRIGRPVDAERVRRLVYAVNDCASS